MLPVIPNEPNNIVHLYGDKTPNNVKPTPINPFVTALILSDRLLGFGNRTDTPVSSLAFLQALSIVAYILLIIMFTTLENYIRENPIRYSP